MSVAAPPLPQGEALQARQFRPVRNAALTGLQCLRCQRVYPLTLANDGCEACMAQGVHVSLAASYSTALSGKADALSHAPYLKSFTLDRKSVV